MMKENIELIKGHFSPAEAADVLLSLINEKIKYHQVRSLNLREEPLGKKMDSEERISALKSAKNTIEQLVLRAHKNGKILSVNGTICIELEESYHHLTEKNSIKS